jgi:hypothetical protein
MSTNVLRRHLVDQLHRAQSELVAAYGMVYGHAPGSLRLNRDTAMVVGEGIDEALAALRLIRREALAELPLQMLTRLRDAEEGAA